MSHNIMNFDLMIVTESSKQYAQTRKNTFAQMFLKHLKQSCKCISKSKVCGKIGSLDLNRCFDMNYINKQYECGLIDTLYNIMQSVTQSLRCNTGKRFETIIEHILTINGVNFKSQVKLQEHFVDFVIYKNDSIFCILSCKTTLRERILQDKYLKHKVIYLTMEKTTEENCISIDSENQSFTKFLDVLPKAKPMALDLFCGAGGFSTGISKYYDIVAGIDNWQTAIDSYSKNHAHLALCKDLETYGPQDFEGEYKYPLDIELIFGSPPCQGFSQAGKRNVMDPRNSLFKSFVKYVDYFKPKYFVMENVPGLLSMTTSTGEKCIDIILQSFVDIGYITSVYKLCASDFGVPQNRRRIFIFGCKEFKISQPEGTLSVLDRTPVSSILESIVDEKYFLSEKAIFGILKKKHRSKENGNGFGAQFLDLNKPCFTIPARYWKDGYDALVKYSDTKIRKLTLNELRKVQSFPDEYIFSGSSKDIIMQIGNAVPCLLSEAVGKHLFNYCTLTENKICELQTKTKNELAELARKIGKKGWSKLKKVDLINWIKTNRDQ
jgi:DNA (cytosine-5)-methyltransferase 1